MIQFKLKDLVYPKRLAWDVIIADIYEAGITPSQTSDLMGQGWSSFQRWQSGVEPRHSIGVSILTIHTRYCGEELTKQRLSEGK
ncbi:MAG: hypothetical protein PVI03_07345 [Candidatus Thorarchaeota archaeon]|jgi:hypothetical protein